MKCALIISALLAILVGLTVADDEPIPIFTRSCSLCRLSGYPKSCTLVTRSYVQCIGIYVYSVAACIRRSGLYLTEPKKGCYMV